MIDVFIKNAAPRCTAPPSPYIPVSMYLCLTLQIIDSIRNFECQCHSESFHHDSAARHLVSKTALNWIPTPIQQIGIRSNGYIFSPALLSYFYVLSPYSYVFPYIPTSPFPHLKPTNTCIQPLLQHYRAPTRVPDVCQISNGHHISHRPCLSARNQLDFCLDCFSNCIENLYKAGFRLIHMHQRQQDIFLVSRNGSLQLWLLRGSVSSPFMRCISPRTVKHITKIVHRFSGNMHPPETPSHTVSDPSHTGNRSPDLPYITRTPFS